MTTKTKVTKKRILFVNPDALFPTTTMTRVRGLSLIKGLAAENHSVDVAAICRSKQDQKDTQEGLKDICRNFFPLKALNAKTNFLGRKYYGLKHALLHYLFGILKVYSYHTNQKITRQIIDLVNKNQYDIILSESWYMGRFFHKLPGELYKVLDSYAVVEENREGYLRKMAGKKPSFFVMREYDVTTKLQYRCIKAADLMLNVSNRGTQILQENAPELNCMTIPIGQDLDHYANYETNPQEKTLLFFGNMGNQQNKHAFSRLWNRIVPLLRKQIPDLKLLVVGSNPPEEVKKLHDGEKVIITGFVEDPREHLSKATLMILPLESSSGFRGRMVEVMAMGLPVIGTHNALDSIEMTDGVHGFITDSDEEMVETAVRLMKKPQLRQKISAECKKFVYEKYSIEATTGKLSAYFDELEIQI